MQFLRNTWYVATWDDEVARTPLARTICNEPIVFFRKEDGTPVALADTCPHRFAPLSMGKCVGDTIECRYHGLRFDGQGACVLNPHGDGRIPQAAVVKNYAVVERHKIIWIWMGDPKQANPDLIPDYSHIDQTDRYRTIRGRIPTAANYELLIDNLMDLSHAEFLHAGTLGSPAFRNTKHSVRQSGPTTVHSDYWIPNGPAAPLWAKRFDNYQGDVDHWLELTWHAPCVTILTGGVTKTGRPREEGIQQQASHIITPETEMTSHYFWANSRDYHRDDMEMEKMMAENLAKVFHEEDGGMLEAVQRRMGTPDLWSLKPVLLSVDTAAVRVRRILQSLIAHEAEEK